MGDLVPADDLPDHIVPNDDLPDELQTAPNPRADLVNKMESQPKTGDLLVDPIHAAASGLYHSIVGGYKGLATLPQGVDAATQAVREEQAKTYRPSDENQKIIDRATSFAGAMVPASQANPQPVADYLADKSADLGASPGVSTTIKAAPTALAALTGVRGLLRGEASAAPLKTFTPEEATAQTGRQSIGAAQVSPSPFTLTGQETGRGSPSFPQVKLAKNSGDVAPAEQSTRAGIIKEVLHDSGEDAGIRTGVLTGNEQTLRSEYQAAKNPNQAPANALMADQIGAEQRALPKFAQQRIDATGADPTLTNDYQRGETINGAFYGEGGLKDYLTQQKRKIFQAALEKNGDTQIPTATTDQLLTDPQFVAGSKLMKHEGVVNGASDLINLAKTVGFKDPVTGTQYAPGSVAAWNAVTKALNRGWTPDNSVTIGKINGAINQDIAASGGGELYQLGNRVHQLDKGLLSDSPGINQVFGTVDPNGIQTAKSFENIPSTLNNMPLDQWRHIHDTLDGLSRGHLRDAPEGMDPVPPELRQAAERAKAEMQGSLAREVYSQGAGNAGGWNANSANKALNGRVGQKILDALPPDEIRKFQVLNAAGHIMPGTHPYEGAGAQIARMGSGPGFVETYAPKAGILLGAKTGIPGAALLGENVGARLSGLTRKSREAKQAANVGQTLRDNLNREAGGRVEYASGGKVESTDVLVNRLMTRWKHAKKATDATTKPLLHMPDAAIVKALDIAQEHI